MNTLDKFIFSGTLIASTQLTRLLPLFLNKHSSIKKILSTKTNLTSKIIFLFLILYSYRDLTLQSEYFARIVSGIFIGLLQYKIQNLFLSIVIGTCLYLGILTLI